MFSTRVGKKSAGKMGSMRLLAVLLVPAVALILGAVAPQAWADEFEDAKIIFETNFSARDTGLQIFLDGGPWKEVEIRGPNGEILDIEAEGKLRNFGLTEAFFETNEPNWDDMSLTAILARFPKGNYRFKGITTDGRILRSTASLSHRLPCAPTNLSPSKPIELNGDPVTIRWDAVTKRLGIESEICDGGPITIVTYQVIVENLETEKDFSIFLEAEDYGNEVDLPDQFVTDDTVYKFEVLAIAANGNQTIAEGFFCTGEPAGGCEPPE